jgi:hypothetical protein
MRLTRNISVLALAAVLLGGCDSGSSEDVPPTELVVGNWTMTKLVDGSGDLSGLIGTVFDSITASFTQQGQVVLRIASGFQADAVVSGTYTVNESAATLNLSVVIVGLGDGERVNLDFGYAFRGSDEMTLNVTSATTDLFSQLFALPLRSPLTLTMQRD